MPNHLSTTQLNMLMGCGMQYYHRYVLGKKKAPNVSLIRGDGTHTSVEANMKAKLNDGDGISLAEAADVARDKVNQRWELEGVRLIGEEKEQGEKKMRGATVDDAVGLAQLHHTEIAPEIRPAYVEREFRLTIDGSRDIVGFIDVQQTGPDQLIRDTKTTAKTPGKAAIEALKRNVQLDIYGMAQRTLDGKREEHLLVVDYLINLKARKTMSLAAVRTDDDFRRLMVRIERANKVIDSGVFMPTNPDDWRCSAKWCGYFDECDYGSRKKVQVTIGESS